MEANLEEVEELHKRGTIRGRRRLMPRSRVLIPDSSCSCPNQAERENSQRAVFVQCLEQRSPYRFRLIVAVLREMHQAELKARGVCAVGAICWTPSVQAKEVCRRSAEHERHALAAPSDRSLVKFWRFSTGCEAATSETVCW